MRDKGATDRTEMKMLPDRRTRWGQRLRVRHAPSTATLAAAADRNLGRESPRMSEAEDDGREDCGGGDGGAAGVKAKDAVATLRCIQPSSALAAAAAPQHQPEKSVEAAVAMATGSVVKRSGGVCRVTSATSGNRDTDTERRAGGCWAKKVHAH